MILKNEAEPNQILLMNQDGTSKDSKMMDDIMQGTIKIDGVSIQRIVNGNQDYFKMLKKNMDSPHRQR